MSVWCWPRNASAGLCQNCVAYPWNEEIAAARTDWEAGDPVRKVTAYNGQRPSAPSLTRFARPNPVSRHMERDEMAVYSTPHETHVVVRGTGVGFAQEITAGTHRFAADEPTTHGGADTGPTPYDLLLAALGS